MHRKVKGVAVDSGMIMICDEDYYKEYEIEKNIDENISTILKVEPGTYRVFWSIKDTWNGDIDGDEIVNIKSGNLIVSDPCYCIGKNWDKWLEDTKFGEVVDDALLISSMGGDGTYDIDLFINTEEK